MIGLSQLGVPYPPVSDVAIFYDGLTGPLIGGVWTKITWVVPPLGFNPRPTGRMLQYRTLNYDANNSRWFPPPGLLYGCAILDFADAPSATYGMWVVKSSNFADLSYYYLYRQNTNFNFSLSLAFAYWMYAGDYIELWGYSPTGRTPIIRRFTMFTADNVNGQADLSQIQYLNQSRMAMIK